MFYKFAFIFFFYGAAVMAETQNTVSLTTSQMLPGDSGSFTSTQVSGASANAAGTLYHTYGGAMKFGLSTATGRYSGLAGSTAYGIGFGPFMIFRSFLSSNYFTTVSSSTICPGATTYNWIGIRYRAYSVTNGQNATSSSFFAGGRITYDPNAADVMTGESMFDLAGPNLDSSPDYAFDGFSGASCGDGNLKVLADGSDFPMDSKGTFFFGDSAFLFMAGGGNPMATIGVAAQTLSAPSMAALSESVFTGMYTVFTSTQNKQNVYVYPDSNGTTFSLYTANDLDDPTNRTLLGTIACTSLNSPDDGFCSGTLTLDGVGGSGNAVCTISTDTPEWVLACSAQYPADNRSAVSLLARVANKALLSVTLDQSYYAVADIDVDATITATVTNLSGRAAQSMGAPSNPALQLSGAFSLHSSAFTGGGGGNCGTTLGGYQSCTITIVYNPSSVGTSFQTFRVAYDDGYYGTVNSTARLVGLAELSSIEVTPSTASFSAGSVVQYTATATYSDASTQDVTLAVDWSSDNTSVATISSAGVATFLQTGSINFTATLGSQSDGQGVTSSSGGTIEVLGQPTPDGLEGAITGLNVPTDSVIAGGRLFVVDTTNNRVLIWDAIPTSSDTPADLVLGQPDLDTYDVNSDGVSAHSLSGPTGIASDGTRLVVADTGNNRVLVWSTLPTATAEDADLVLGQANFTNNGNNAGSANQEMNDPIGVAISGTGASADLFVADQANHRVMIWTTFPTSNHQAMDLVLGQTNPSTKSGANRGGTVAANTLDTPALISTDGTSLFVVDNANHRVLVWDSIPSSNGENASRALGQPDLTSNASNNGVPGTPASTSMRSPYGVHVNGTNLYVSDNGNNRVLIWTALPVASGEAADLVLGQSGFTTRAADQGGIGSSTLEAPRGLTVYSSKLYVMDTTNHRILIWNSIPTTNKEASNVVLGQVDFTHSESNSVGYPDSGTLRQPSSVTSCNSKLIIADTSNHRVLIWNSIPTSNGTAADVVLGQPDFASNTLNNGGRSGSTLRAPNGVYCDGTRLFVADTGNHRVLMWNTVPTVNQTAADLVLGQSTLTAGASNQGGLGQATLSSPRGVYSTGSSVFVADTANNRVMVWDNIPASNKEAADFVLGQPDFVTNTALATPSSQSLRAPYSVHGDGTRLFVADYDNMRVLMWTTLPTGTAEAADLVLGQSDFTTRTADQGGLGASTLDNPTSVFADGTSLFIADYDNHRVLIHDAYPTTDKEAADRVIGQPNFTTATANYGGIDANSLNRPRAVYSDTNRVFIADYNNYRATVVSVKARLSISDGPTYDYGDIVVGNTAIYTFTVTNIGAQAATSMQAGTPALSSPFSFVGGSYPGTSGTCGASLAGSASCTIRVQFNPSSEAATFSDVVRVQFYNGSSNEVAVVSVTGRSVLQSTLTFTDGASYSFGSVAVGNSAHKTLTVSNASGVTATLMREGSPALATNFSFRGGEYPGTGGTCGTVLEDGDTCTVVVTFAPVSTGAKGQTFYLSYYNGSYTTTGSIALSGTGF